MGGGVRTAYASGVVSTSPDVGGQVASAAAPQYPLRLGGTSASNALKGYAPQLLLYGRALPDADIQALAEFFGGEYGLAKIRGCTGFAGDGSSYFVGTGNTGVRTGFWVASLFKIDSQTVAGATRAFSRTLSGGAGYSLGTGGSNGVIRWTAYDDGATLALSPSYAITAPDIGKLHLAVAVHDGANMRLYVARAEVGTGTPITGYKLPAGLTRIGDGCDGLSIFGVAQGHAVPTLAQVQAYYDTVKAAGKLVPMAGVATQHVWNTNAAGTITDEVGTEPMTVFGTLSTVRHQVQWAW